MNGLECVINGHQNLEEEKYSDLFLRAVVAVVCQQGVLLGAGRVQGRR